MNCRHVDFQSTALPPELSRHQRNIRVSEYPDRVKHFLADFANVSKGVRGDVFSVDSIYAVSEISCQFPVLYVKFLSLGLPLDR